jgi:hypothetical protein
LNDETWSEAVSLQHHIEFNNGGNCTIVTQDEKYLFFLDIYEGKWERYWVQASFIEKLNQEELIRNY